MIIIIKMILLSTILTFQLQRSEMNGFLKKLKKAHGCHFGLTTA